MKKLTLPLSLVLVCGAVQAQSNALSISPSAVNYSVRSPKIYPGWRYMYPETRILSVQVPSGQSWTATVSGTLTSACLYFESCFRLTEEYSSQAISSGTGPHRVAVNWYGSQPPNLDPGNYGATITFTLSGGGAPVTVPVNLEVLGATSLPATPEMKATAIFEKGCVLPDPVFYYTYAVRCDVPNQAPTADPQLTQPAVGQEVTDPSFGSRIRRITPPGCFTEYGTTTAFSAHNTYALTSCGIFRTADATLLPGPHVDLAYSFMSAVDDQVLIYMSGTKLRRFNFVTGDDTVLGDYGGAPYKFQALYAGGTAGGSDDDWVSFYEYSAGPYPQLCAVDVAALRAAGMPGPSNTYCGVYKGTLPLSFLDWVSVSDVDGPTGKRYVYLSSIPVSVVFSIGAKGSGTLTQEYIIPEWPGWARNNDDGVCTENEYCYNAGHFTHDSLYLDRDGQVNLFAKFEDILGNRNYVSTYRLNAGLRILRLQANGGGQRILGRMEPDYQPGCSSQIGGCTVAALELAQRFAARVIAADIATDRTRLTLSSSPHWAQGSTRMVRVQNGTGNWSCLNGGWTAMVVSDTQLEIPAICSMGTGSLAKVLLGDATDPLNSSQKDNGGQIQVWRPERQVHRVAMHRSVTWIDVPGSGINTYYTSPRASLSRDGRYVAFNSNWGALDFDGPSVYVAETGLGDPANRITLKEITPGQNGAAISYELPSAAACTFEVSADPTFQHAVETFTDSGGAVSRQTYLGQSLLLTPNSNYWMRMQCGLEVESASFHTLPARADQVINVTTELGGTDTVTAVDALVQYRAAGTTQFTSSQPQLCSNGCRLTWQGKAGGVSEYRVLYRDANANVIYTGQINTMTHPPR